MSGTPIISSDFGCMPELMNEKIGIICKNQTDFAKAILSIKNLKSSDCLEYGLKYFSPIIASKKYLRYYQNMLNLGKVV